MCVPPATLRTVERAAATRLREAGIESALLDARVLMGYAFGLSRDQLLCRAGDAADPEHGARFEALIVRRLAREPVSRILGRREFWSLDFALSADTLDPRPDSETLVEAALAEVAGRGSQALDVLDLGTGTGCLLLAVLSELPAARGLGIDLSPGAVATATGNARSLGLDRRARFACRDWRDGLVGRLDPVRYDLVLANPPYIPSGVIDGLEPEVARFDPIAALEAGEDGLDAYRTLAGELPGLLAPDGVAVFEVGAGQAPAVAGLVSAVGLEPVGTRKDLAGIDRCVVVRTKSRKAVVS